MSKVPLFLQIYRGSQTPVLSDILVYILASCNSFPFVETDWNWFFPQLFIYIFSFLCFYCPPSLCTWPLILTGNTPITSIAASFQRNLVYFLVSFWRKDQRKERSHRLDEAGFSETARCRLEQNKQVVPTFSEASRARASVYFFGYVCSLWKYMPHITRMFTDMSTGPHAMKQLRILISHSIFFFGILVHCLLLFTIWKIRVESVWKYQLFGIALVEITYQYFRLPAV